MQPHTTRWGAIRFLEGGMSFCPVTAWCYAKTGRIFQVWQLYEAGRLVGWTKLKCWAIAVLADLAVVPFRRRALRQLAPEVFTGDPMVPRRATKAGAR